jgi:hypothetical protein
MDGRGGGKRAGKEAWMVEEEAREQVGKHGG